VNFRLEKLSALPPSVFCWYILRAILVVYSAVEEIGNDGLN
jgi:hypothetical protein